jgi:ABC-2 type transport system ATP-binding protein
VSTVEPEQGAEPAPPRAAELAPPRGDGARLDPASEPRAPADQAVIAPNSRLPELSETVASDVDAARASSLAARAVPPRPRVAALVVERLSKNYEGALAVDDLSFRVEAGEILGLVGPNGAGKTTTLRSIAGVLPLHAGTVTISGEDLARSEVKAKQQLAWIPDDPQPFDSLTVHEHLRFTAALYGVRDWQARADRLLERFELVHKRDALGGELSRGMRQKLAFCCAWLHKPGVVLMDEPLSGLDPRGIRSAKLAIQELAREGTAVILSSHLLELIEELAHRILIVDHGRKVFAGTLAEARASLRVHEGSSLEEIFLAVTESSDSPDARSRGDDRS